jgi:hypothetical protein
MAKDPAAKLESFVTELEKLFGDNVTSIVLFGDAVRGTHDEKHPELRVLVVLQNTHPKALRPVGRAIAGWVRAGQPPPLIFSERGWREGVDVFPIEIEDMREAHRLLRGTDPFDGLHTSSKDLRHELEREIRGKLLQLRAEFAATEADGRALGELLVASAKTFFVLFRALLRATDQTPPAELPALVRDTARTAGLETTAFDWVLAKITGSSAPNLEPFDEIGVQYVQAIEQLADFVDRIVPESN